MAVRGVRSRSPAARTGGIEAREPATAPRDHPLRITVIGRSPAWQDAGGACSGYLVEHSRGALLVDCGNGVFGKLRQLRDHRSVDTVVVTHMHGDHVLDLVPFSYALLYGPERTEGRPKLLLPPGGLAVMRAITGSFDKDTLVEEAFEASEYDPTAELSIGDLTVRFQPVPHFIEAWALSIADCGARFVFGADCGPNEELARFAQGADLLMLEAAFPQGTEGGEGHLTPEQAGAIARGAGVDRLVLTHASDCFDLVASREAASREFGGPVEVAAEGSCWDL